MDKLMDYSFLDRELDKAKSSVFMGSTAAFLGSIMCSLKFEWKESIGTAGTDGVHYWWAPSYFQKLIPEARKTEIQHELWHVARLHMARLGNRCPKYWNIACDIVIDLDLEAQGCNFTGVPGVLTWSNLNAHQYVGWVEEDVYDDLQKNGFKVPNGYTPDMIPGNAQTQIKAVNAVVKAIQQAKMTGSGCGSLPGGLEEIITKFLTPIVPWEQVLYKFMTELQENGYSWKKPNRRYMDFYLPSRYEEDGALMHLAFIEDVSGSISDADRLRFNSEVKYVKDTFVPKKLTLIQFDDVIQGEKTFEENDRFDQVEYKYGGGTDLAPVRDWIIKHRPTAAIIFSDLYCAPMEPLPFEIPVIWVAISNHGATVPFGQIVHIR